jgi:acyl-CoA dehydrogenase
VWRLESDVPGLTDDEEESAVSWEFETDPEFEDKLAWMRAFVREEIEPLELVYPDDVYRMPQSEDIKLLLAPLKKAVKERGLWAAHLGPNLGGQGYGQVKLALMNEILAQSPWGPRVFGCQAPDTGNAEILAHYGTPAQKAKYWHRFWRATSSRATR